MTWSFLLAAVGVAGILLAGRARPAIGWTVGVAAQLLWVAYALATGQYGFLASAAAYGSVYGLNLARAVRRARADRVVPATPSAPTPADPTGALGPNATACPVCPDTRRVANPLLEGHLYLHHLRGQG